MPPFRQAPPPRASRQQSRRPRAATVSGAHPEAHPVQSPPLSPSSPVFSAQTSCAHAAQAPPASKAVIPTNGQACADGLVRINKALADAGLCSRRKAEELIAKGLVQINGETVMDMGRKVAASDVLSVDGRVIQRPKAHAYVLMHKPSQVMCTASDPDGRTTIFDLLPPPWRGQRLFSVGRLDYFSEGLIILTDDGALAQKLAHPRHHLPKVYHVLLREFFPEEARIRMRQGMTLAEGEKLAPVEVRILPNQSRSTLIEMTLHQGINRQIRRMCRDLGLTILKLTRVAQGPLQLGELAPGKARVLTEEEVAQLYALTQ